MSGKMIRLQANLSCFLQMVPLTTDAMLSRVLWRGELGKGDLVKETWKIMILDFKIFVRVSHS